MSAVQTPLHGEEPPMYLQRPSSARSQDVTHILARTFRQLFTRDSVAPDTVQNLTQSKGGDDPYHEKYVEQLQKVSNILTCYAECKLYLISVIDDNIQ